MLHKKPSKTESWEKLIKNIKIYIFAKKLMQGTTLLKIFKLK